MLVVPADMSDLKSCPMVVKAAVDKFGSEKTNNCLYTWVFLTKVYNPGLDGVVNNAAIVHAALAIDTTDEVN